MSFPTIVYRSPGLHAGPFGKTYSFLGVDDAAGLAVAIAAGWSLTLPEACADKAPPAPPPDALAAPDDAPPTREELNAKALDLGIKLDGRLSDARLARMIEDAIALKG